MTEKLSILMILLIFLNCTSKPAEHIKEKNINIREYYYPLDRMEGGMMFVYKYNNVNTEFIWHLQTQKQKDSLYLKVLILREDNTIEQKITEQIYPSGSTVIDYEIMEIDSNGNEGIAYLDIQSGHAFPFEVEKDGGVYIFQLKWFFPSDPELKYTLVRNRRYVGDTTFLFKGVELPAIIMNVKELLETEQEGRQAFDYEKIEIYAKGLGLASSKMIYNDTIRSAFSLVDTISGKLLISGD